MIFLVILLFVFGVFLSAFFSGSETGFYRASRIRFLMDGLDGDHTSRRMLWLFNNPTLFVATSLVGNNVANYLVSLAIVLAVQLMLTSESNTAEIIAPIVLSPALFVYGELMPKSIYFISPNKLLRRSAPLFLFFTALFAPVSAVLWCLARFLESMVGQSPEKVRFMLARGELQDVLEEGQEIGILHPSQRLLAQNFFIEATRPVSGFCTPVSRLKALPATTTRDRVLKFARRHRLTEIPLFEKNRSNLIGFVRTVDLLVKMDRGDQVVEPKPLPKINSKELFGEALLRMQTKRESVCLVVGDRGESLGVLSIDQLRDKLLKGPLGSLRR